jgi:HEAT repeat protein
VRISCLNALGTLAQGDEEVIEYLNVWLQQENTIFQTGKVPDVYVISAAVRALAQLGDKSSFPVLFNTMTIGYTDDISRSAREGLFRLGGELKENMIGILKESALEEKKLALQMSVETDRLDETAKAEIAQFAMDVGLHTAMVDNPSRQIARDIRYIAAQALTERKWSAATDLAIEHFDTVLLEYDRGLTDKRRVVEAVECLGAMGTHEAAVRLTQYLVLLNAYTERQQEFDNIIVLAVVENLGILGDKTAFDDLLYAQYLSYSSEIKNAAREALDNLNW